jgi:hypothetical protein
MVLAYRYIKLFNAWVLSVSFHCKFGWSGGTIWTMQRVFVVFPQLVFKFQDDENSTCNNFEWEGTEVYVKA